jgi:hypothetical protein
MPITHRNAILMTKPITRRIMPRMIISTPLFGSGFGSNYLLCRVANVADDTDDGSEKAHTGPTSSGPVAGMQDGVANVVRQTSADGECQCTAYTGDADDNPRHVVVDDSALDALEGAHQADTWFGTGAK